MIKVREMTTYLPACRLPRCQAASVLWMVRGPCWLVEVCSLCVYRQAYMTYEGETSIHHPRYRPGDYFLRIFRELVDPPHHELGLDSWLVRLSSIA